MKVQKLMVFISCCLLTLVVTANLARALTINTSAEYLITSTEDGESGPVTTTISTQTAADTGVSLTVSSEVPGGMIVNPPTTVGASALGDEDGYIAASAQFMDSMGYDYSASAHVDWTETFYAATTGSYSWDFTITGGELSLEDYAGLGLSDGLTSAYAMGITINGTEQFASAATLTGGTWESDYIETGTDIGGNYFGGGSSHFGYQYDPYSGTIDLGTFAAGEAIVVSYNLDVSVGGPAYETGANAFIGDPGNLSGGAFSGSLTGGGQTPPAPVPEPSTILLMGLGLLGLVGIKKARKRS